LDIGEQVAPGFVQGMLKQGRCSLQAKGNPSDETKKACIEEACVYERKENAATMNVQQMLYT
jgi:hypothetical protein